MNKPLLLAGLALMVACSEPDQKSVNVKTESNVESATNYPYFDVFERNIFINNYLDTISQATSTKKSFYKGMPFVYYAEIGVTDEMISKLHIFNAQVSELGKYTLLTNRGLIAGLVWEPIISKYEHKPLMTPSDDRMMNLLSRITGYEAIQGSHFRD